MTDRILQDCDINELRALLAAWNEPAYRAKQIFSKLAAGTDVSDMTDLPKTLRERLKETFVTRPVGIETVRSSSDGSKKFLFVLADGNLVEGVYMPHDYGRSACLSTQVGCRMGCAFCASGIDGRVRDLTAGEILCQAVEMARTGGRLDNIVLMGSGEPLDNYDNVTKFIRLINDPSGVGLGQRSIALSTCGLCDGIRRLADDGFSVTLSVSLHATTDENRRKIMPVAKKYTLAELTEAAKYYFSRTGRRIVYEYALIKDNMTVFDVERLARITSGYSAHVNLIMVNPVKERPVIGCTRAEAERFRSRLERTGVSVTIRRSMGADIEGACGQLRRRYKEKTD